MIFVFVYFLKEDQSILAIQDMFFVMLIMLLNKHHIKNSII